MAPSLFWLSIMNNLVIDKKLHILCANKDKYVFHPSKLSSFNLKAFLNKSFVECFQFLSQPKSLEATINFFSTHFGMSEKVSKNILNSLIESGFIRVCDHSHASENLWKINNWNEALNFHLHTNNLPKMMYNTKHGEKDDVILMEQYVKDKKIPSSYKYCNGTDIPLVKPTLDKKYKIPHLISLDKKASKLDFHMLSRLLYYAFGQIGTRNMRVTGNHIRKTVPSGGARHPIEVYLIISDISGLNAGIYHYNVKKHALTLLKSLEKEKVHELIKKNILLDANRPGFAYSVAIAYSCVFARSMFRYRESRSYRVMHFDMGHITQNLSLLTRAYSLNLYSGYSCHESEIENLIGIDSLMESIISYSIL